MTHYQAIIEHKDRQLAHCKSVLVEELNWLDQMMQDDTSISRRAVYQNRRNKIAFALGYANT